jgi:hypothetical protein
MPIGNSLIGRVWGSNPVILGVSPSTGPAGTLVTIQMENTQGATGATIGGVPLTSFTIVDATHVSGVTGAHADGLVSAIVSNSLGPSAPASYTYTSSGVTIIPAPFNGLITIAYDGTSIWAATVRGSGANSGHLISKVDTTLAAPAVTATVNISEYADGGLGGLNPINVRQVRSDGNHVFAGLQTSYDSIDVSYSGFLLVIDKTTNTIVGHYRATGAASSGRPYSIRSITFDGAGHVFAGQTPGAGEVGAPTVIHKFLISDMLAAYPTYATPIASFTLTNPYIENITYGGGYLWTTHGNGGSAFLTRVDPTTGVETEYALPTWSAWGVAYLFGSVWVGGAQSSTTTPLLRFDPATFPSDPTYIATPSAMYAGGMSFASDGTNLWFGGNALRSAFRFDVTLGSEVTVASVLMPGNGTPSDLIFDGVNVWTPSRGADRLARIDLNSNAVDYVLVSGGPPVPHAPVLSFVSPPNGPQAGGTQVYIYTDDSTGAISATVGGVDLTSFSIFNANYVTGITSAHTAGLTDVTVTNATGTSNPLTNGYEFLAPTAPTVYSISPGGGSPSGGTVVTISVDDSTGATGAAVGGVPLTSFSIVDINDVQGTTGSHVAGVVDVTVTNAVGPGTLAGAFTYAAAPVVVSISPTVGTPAGGTTVTIRVDNSAPIVAAYIDDVVLSSFAIVDATHVSGVTASHTAGSNYTVKVLNGGGLFGSLANAFTFGDAPTITFLDTTTGPAYGGTATNIFGSGFTGATAVAFGGTAVASFSIGSDGFMSVVTGAHAGGGVVDVTVTGPTGLVGTRVNGFTYHVPTPPTFTSVEKTARDVVGGESNAVFGTGYTYTTNVTVDGISTTFTVYNDTTLGFICPAHARGLVDVVVTADGAIGTMTNAFKYFVPAHFHYTESLTYDGTKLWWQGQDATSNVPFAQKLDPTLSPIEVIAQTNAPQYVNDQAFGGRLTRHIGSSGQYVYVCTVALHTALTGDISSFCFVIDKTTNAVVGHVKMISGAPGDRDVVNVEFDGAGNFFVLTTGDGNGTAGKIAVLAKFNTAAVVAAYPSFGTPIWTTTLPGGASGTQRSYTGSLTYSPNGYLWTTRYDRVLTRFNASTGAVNEYVMMHWNNTTHSFPGFLGTSVKYMLGSLWVCGIPPASTPGFTEHIQRYDVNDVTNGGAAGTDSDDLPFHTGTGLPITTPLSKITAPAQPGVLSTIETDGTYLWVGAASTFNIYRFSTTLGSEALVSTISGGSVNSGVSGLTYDGTSMWFTTATSSSLVRVTTGTPGSETMTALNEHGPYGF